MNSRQRGKKSSGELPRKAALLKEELLNIDH